MFNAGKIEDIPPAKATNHLCVMFEHDDKCWMDDYQLVIPVKFDFSTDLTPSEMIGSNWIMLDKLLMTQRREKMICKHSPLNITST